MVKIQTVVIHDGPQGAKGDPSLTVGPNTLALGSGQYPKGDGTNVVARDFAMDVAATAAVQRVDPGTAGSAGQHLAIGPGDLPVWIKGATVVVTDPRFGGQGDGTTDNADPIAEALAASWASGNEIIDFPKPTGAYKVARTVAVSHRGYILRGHGGQATGAGGTQLTFTGTGPLFELGTDNGLSYTTPTFDGVADQTFENLYIVYGGASTAALANGLGTYGPGAYAVRDWRGGNISLRGTTFSGFEYGFWGVQSDVNTWMRPTFAYCKVAAYLGPGSAQLTAYAPYTLFNDCGFWLDNIQSARIHDWQVMNDGTPTTAGSRITSTATTWPCDGIVISDARFETGTPATQPTPAALDIGVGDTVMSRNIELRNPWVSVEPTTLLSATFAQQALARIGNADNIRINNPGGPGGQMIDHLLRFTGATSPRVWVSGWDGAGANTSWVNEGTGTPKVLLERRDANTPNPAVVLHATVGTSQTAIPHGQPYTPAVLGVTPKADARVWESAPADATNVYLTASASADTTITVGLGDVLPAYATLTLSDTFTGANGTALSAHTPDSGAWTNNSSGLTIQSNKLQASVVGSRPYVTTASADHLVQATVNLGAGTGAISAGVMFRVAGSNNYWRFYIATQDSAPTGYIALEAVGGGPTVVARRAFPIADTTDYVLRVEARGDRARCFIANQLVIDYAGINAYQSTATAAGIVVSGFGTMSSPLTFDNVIVRSV